MPKILIIEDEKVLAEMYKDKLEEEGFEADVAFSSEEAMDYLQDEKPDLILLDILLPKESGVSFLKRIKETGGLSGTIIIAFSNYDEPNAKKEAIALGAKAYLIKTQYTPGELVDEIKKFLVKR